MSRYTLPLEHGYTFNFGYDVPLRTWWWDVLDPEDQEVDGAGLSFRSDGSQIPCRGYHPILEAGDKHGVDPADLKTMLEHELL